MYYGPPSPTLGKPVLSPSIIAFSLIIIIIFNPCLSSLEMTKHATLIAISKRYIQGICGSGLYLRNEYLGKHNEQFGVYTDHI